MWFLAGSCYYTSTQSSPFTTTMDFFPSARSTIDTTRTEEAPTTTEESKKSGYHLPLLVLSHVYFRKHDP